MRAKLIAGEELTCEVCLEYFSSKNFDSEALQQKLEEGPALEPVPDVAKDREAAADLNPDGKSDTENPEPEVPADPFQFAKAQDHIEVLEPGFAGRKFPARCLLCASRRSPNGKLIDMLAAKAETAERALKSHIQCDTHQRRLAELQQRTEVEQVQCPGLSTQNPLAGPLHQLRAEFHQWASLSNIKKFGKHSYWQVANEETWFVRSCRCKQRFVPVGGPNVCDECLALSRHQNVVKSVLAFAFQKYYPAKLLSAKMFQSQESQAELVKEIRASACYSYDSARMESLLQSKPWQLQQVVRARCSSNPSSTSTPAFHEFMSTIVTPALQVNTTNVPSAFSDVVGRMSACIASGRADETDHASLKVALAAMQGQLQGHPMLLGISLQCLRLLEKAGRGIDHMRGRRSKESSRETELIQDAGLTLSLMSGQKELAQKFGMAQRKPSCLGKLKEHSLPSPALALLWPSELAENFRLCDQRFRMTEGQDPRDPDIELG